MRMYNPLLKGIIFDLCIPLHLHLPPPLLKGENILPEPISQCSEANGSDGGEGKEGDIQVGFITAFPHTIAYIKGDTYYGIPSSVTTFLAVLPNHRDKKSNSISN